MKLSSVSNSRLSFIPLRWRLWRPPTKGPPSAATTRGSLPRRPCPVPRPMVERTRSLRESGLTVEAVAVLLGYSDTAAFRKAFRRWYGQAPTAYREEAARAGEP